MYPTRRALSVPTPSVPGVLFVGVGVLLLYLVVPPLVVLVQTSFWVSESLTRGYVGTQNYTDIFTSADLPLLLANSLVFAIGSSALALVFGTLLAWLVERTNAPFKGLAYLSAVVALGIPGIIKAVGWVFLLGPRNGLFN